MKLDKEEAAQALAEIGESQDRSARLYAYSQIAPYLMAAGALWMAADLTLRFSPVAGPWAWPAAALLALPLFIGIAVAQSRRRRRDGRPALDPDFWRGVGAWLLGLVFLMATLAIFSPTGNQLHGFMGLVTGFAFSVIGLWAGWRVLATGLAIGLLTMTSHYLFGPGDNILFMGLVGGGGMMLGAWWLGKA